ncbi:hypothetical protein BU23DRAFT_605017 [Bimuria novae-zelandiae CBS 107.79]|uniref:25S rRNA adenine-N(1) methyltransferase n=1 Tax=Bimuria novae-zelandiae CBS 107.79 TaxID=1447943 RepID=A0A6A5UGK1_9PLEO|nr:hypothetical protein BU23DRAFT_605017 [Bimuria novae-zelandiae CBS 107.79]
MPASTLRLDDCELGGRDVESIDIGSQPRESLLGAVRADEGVDLDRGHVVLLLKGSGNLTLVGLDIDNEDEGVVLLNLLHGGLGVERVDEDLAGIETGLVRDRLAGVLRSAAVGLLAIDLPARLSIDIVGRKRYVRKLEGLRAVEAGALAHLADLVRVDLYISLELPPMAREVKAASDEMQARLIGLTYSLESSFGSSVGLLAGLGGCDTLQADMSAKKRQKSLSHGRPPVSKPKERMTSQRSRTIIRTHHRLQKERAAALKAGNVQLAADIARAIEENGGIKVYQAASKQGQSKDRGGDSSQTLVEWLRDMRVIKDSKQKDAEDKPESRTLLRCLEVGALSITNAISKYPNSIAMTRIDLNSQGTGIEKQNFMERPLPLSSNEQFDIISLSLVLNYIPDPVERGEMLKRTTQFLRRSNVAQRPAGTVLPALFLVLPLPCVENSRYLDEPLLLDIMANLGFSVTKEKKTFKLCYYLFSLTDTNTGVNLPKIKRKDGPAMNNFCIVVE